MVIFMYRYVIYLRGSLGKNKIKFILGEENGSSKKVALMIQYIDN